MSIANVNGIKPAVKFDGSQESKLRHTAQQLEGVFVEQLFKAMRETVPDKGGMVDRNAGEDMFTGMMDAHVAAEAPARWHTGLGEALFRQLRSALPGQAADMQKQAVSMSKDTTTAANGLMAEKAR
ncbi:MAG: rod-binding protein [Gemmatimonadota bacterium]|nr:rod-binding protein [Gemmatimonadota bacterium]